MRTASEESVLLIIALVAVVYSAYFIGERISQSVPDEVPRATRYVDIAIDALLPIMTGLALYALGYRALAIIIPVAVIVARRFVTFTHIYAPLSGIVLGLSTYAMPNEQITIVLLLIAYNYMLGARATSVKRLFYTSIAQPVAALAFMLAITTVLKAYGSAS